MKRLLILLLAIVFVSISCDGRDRKHKTNVEVLKENKLFESFSKQNQFIPENETKIFIDTILSTGFQIKLQYYSLDSDYSTKNIKISGSINKTLNFKNFEAQCEVFKNNKRISHQIINKDLFKQYESPDFWKKAIMQFVWIDYDNSTEAFITLNTSFNIPKTDVYKDFRIIINQFGDVKIKQVNLVKSIL